MTGEGLHSESAFYRRHVDVYRRFAEAEDSPGQVRDLLVPYVAGAGILEIGCGTGKYSRLLACHARWYLGLDRSLDALSTAAIRGLIQGDILDAAVASASVDIVLGTWVLGTITAEGRGRALDECRRVLRPGGRLCLVENDVGGEFEEIRGRFPDATRTEAYNRWLEGNGLVPLQRFNTWFQFDSAAEARSVIGAIWGEEAGSKVRRARIDHRVVVYEWIKPASRSSKVVVAN